MLYWWRKGRLEVGYSVGFRTSPFGKGAARLEFASSEW